MTIAPIILKHVWWRRPWFQIAQPFLMPGIPGMAMTFFPNVFVHIIGIVLICAVLTMIWLAFLIDGDPQVLRLDESGVYVRGGRQLYRQTHFSDLTLPLPPRPEERHDWADIVRVFVGTKEVLVTVRDRRRYHGVFIGCKSDAPLFLIDRFAMRPGVLRDMIIQYAKKAGYSDIVVDNRAEEDAVAANKKFTRLMLCISVVFIILSVGLALLVQRGTR